MDKRKAVFDWLQQQQPAMTDQLLAWCRINSGTFHTAGVNRMAEVLQQAFLRLNATAEVITLPQYMQIDDQGNPAPRALGTLQTWVKRPTAPTQILLCGHRDTVYTEHDRFQDCRFIDANTLNGPGVADMKGGLLVMLYALQALEQLSEFHDVGWRVVINADEEIGSPGSAAYLNRWAADYHYGLVFEPSLTPTGVFAGQRKGSGNFTFVARGKATHVGRDFAGGRNAIVGLAYLMENLHALNHQRNGVTINVGYCHGGGVLNQVPDLALCKVNIRTLQVEDEAWFTTTIETLLQHCQQKFDIQLESHGSFTRTPKLLDKKQTAFYTMLSAAAADMHLTATWEATGGCCDGNNLAAAGLANIDTLGVRGGAIHSNEEFIVLDSLTERAELTARLMLMCKEAQHVHR